MKHAAGLLLLLALVLPATVQANASQLKAHALRRRSVRLRKLQSAQNYRQRIRLGKTVQTRRSSPRRVRYTSEGRVVRVLDGSVLQIELGDRSLRTIRTLGSEAPLIREGSKKEQCFALQARNKLRALVLNRYVRLEEDPSYHKDNRNKFLRYVRLESLDVNGWMIDNGYSFADRTNVHLRSQSYLGREQDAKKNERGLWSNICDYNPNPSRSIEVIE